MTTERQAFNPDQLALPFPQQIFALEYAGLQLSCAAQDNQQALRRMRSCMVMLLGIPEHLLVRQVQATATRCDGNHGGPRCLDPECWNQ